MCGAYKKEIDGWDQALRQWQSDFNVQVRRPAAAPRAACGLREHVRFAQMASAHPCDCTRIAPRWGAASIAKMRYTGTSWLHEHASALPSCTRHAQVLEPLGMFVKTRSRCTAYWTSNGEGGTFKNRMYGRWLAFALNPQQAAVLKAQVGDWACVCVRARGGGVELVVWRMLRATWKCATKEMTMFGCQVKLFNP
jgi:hypothetical protein